jgi:hypothetical protein
VSRGETGFHVRLRESAIKGVRNTYPDVTRDQVWLVEVTNGGYGRDAMHLLLVDAIGGAPVLVEGEQHRIVVWRGQVVGVPRCDYCGSEGHSSSTGTAANCSVRAAEVKEQREASSKRMSARWDRLKAEAAVMQAETAAALDRVKAVWTPLGLEIGGPEEERIGCPPKADNDAAAKEAIVAYPPEWDESDDHVTYHEPLPDTDGPEAA